MVESGLTVEMAQRLKFGNIEVWANKPKAAWAALCEDQSYQRLPNAPEEGGIRVVAISDTHGKHRALDLPEGDILIHSGDISKMGSLEDFEDFADWMADQPFARKLVVAGNHDVSLEEDYYEKNWRRFHMFSGKVDVAHVSKLMRNNKHFTYLQDEKIEVLGLTIYGTPWQPAFFNWAFNLPRGTPCAQAWSKIPTGIDILISHGPPLGYGDLCKGGNRAGCVNLLHEIQHRIKPRYHVFGHIHEAAGVYSDGFTTYVNASSCNLAYQAAHLPQCFSLLPL